MSHVVLRCIRCDAAHTADMVTLRCERCGAPLDVQYTGATPDSVYPLQPGRRGARIPLPLHNPESVVSLGEGNTPCVPLRAVGRTLGLTELYAKLELFNPTGSFKDRGTAIMISVAREHGVTELVEDSSGNAGASVSAYAARAGIKAHVFAPAHAPVAKLRQIEVYEARSHLIAGSREAATDAAIAFCSERKLVYTSHNLSPYFLEGTKSFAYEIAWRFAGDLPRHVVMPVGNGSLFIGAWKGFGELREAGLATQLPRLHCVQARAVMPIVAAHRGESWAPSHGATTVAGGIAVGAPPRLEQVLDVLRRSNGAAVAVGDDDTIRWQLRLAETEGIYAEPTSAAAFAGLEELVRQGEIGPSDSVLVPVTGSGLKDEPPGLRR